MTSVAAGACVGVVGAGTMGSGIAEVAARSGHPVRLLDAAPGAGTAAVAALCGRLSRDVDKGRLERARADEVADRVEVVDDVAAMAGCALVVEAVAERLDVKQQLLTALEEVLDATALLATNTSSLSVTAIAAPLRHPGRVDGMHYFNPAPRMRLVEVVRGEDTAEDVVEAATDLARAWGKTPVACTSTPGFIVNRVARPFYGEAQRMVEEGIADPATIDLVLRECGGFPMGPFELTDLVGQDVNLAVSRSVWEQTFGDPRYAPTVFQQRLVDAGRLGRKTGRGVYDYRDGADGARPPVASEPRRPVPEPVRVHDNCSFGPMASFFERVAAVVPVELVPNGEDDRSGALLPDGALLQVTSGARATYFGPDATGGLILLDWAHDPARCTRVVLSAGAGCSSKAIDAAVGLCQAAGVDVTLVRDGPGCVVARTVAMIVNEAVELVTRREATASDVDVAMVLGTGYPSGPLEWGDRVTADWVHRALQSLSWEYPSGRYRPSLALDDAARVDGKLRDL
jgi:3-hydroxybutyryl-CoA dehydrogenase